MLHPWKGLGAFLLNPVSAWFFCYCCGFLHCPTESACLGGRDHIPISWHPWLTRFVGDNNQKPELRLGDKATTFFFLRLPLSRENKSLGNLVCLGLLGDGGSRHLSLASDWDTPGTDFTSDAILIQASAGAGALDSDNGSELLGFEHLPF